MQVSCFPYENYNTIKLIHKKKGNISSWYFKFKFYLISLKQFRTSISVKNKLIQPNVLIGSIKKVINIWCVSSKIANKFNKGEFYREDFIKYRIHQ